MPLSLFFTLTLIRPAKTGSTYVYIKFVCFKEQTSARRPSPLSLWPARPDTYGSTMDQTLRSRSLTSLRPHSRWSHAQGARQHVTMLSSDVTKAALWDECRQACEQASEACVVLTRFKVAASAQDCRHEDSLASNLCGVCQQNNQFICTVCKHGWSRDVCQVEAGRVTFDRY